MKSLLQRCRARWSPWANALDSLVFPRRCPACDVPLSGAVEKGSFCDTCVREIKLVESPFCSICAEPFPGLLLAEFRCPNCMGKEQPYRFAMASGMGEGPLRETIHKFKYTSRSALRIPLARMLYHTLQQDTRLRDKDWLLVPVPLHARRQRERGFNQSEELVRALARLSKLPLCLALRRDRYTTAQATLERSERQKNLKNAFSLSRAGRRHIAGRSVLLIDDVFTTGSTGAECARILTKGGAAEVVVLAAARA